MRSMEAGEVSFQEDNSKYVLSKATSVARTLACSLVVLVHINLYIRPGIENWWPGGFVFAPFFAIPVPMFFIISGFFAGRFSKQIHRPNLFIFLRKKFKGLILPFLTWNVILLFLARKSLSLGNFLFFLFTGYWHLYYVFVLLQLLILNFYLERSLDNHRLNWFLAAAAFLSFVFYGIADLVLWTKGAVSGVFEAYLISTCFPWIIFFAVGVWLRHRDTAINWLLQKKYWLIGLSFISYLAYFLELHLEEEWVGYNPLKQFLLSGLPFRIFFPLLVLVFLYQLANSGKVKVLLMRLTALSKDTYGIYLAHIAVLILLFALWNKFVHSTGHWIEVPIFWAAIWLVCWGIISFVRDMRWRWIGLFVFGIITRRGRVHEAVE